MQVLRHYQQTADTLTRLPHEDDGILDGAKDVLGEILKYFTVKPERAACSIIDDVHPTTLAIASP